VRNQKQKIAQLLGSPHNFKHQTSNYCCLVNFKNGEKWLIKDQKLIFSLLWN
jgi:hypothetical protein